MIDYPLFLPPQELAVKTPREWDILEAEKYYSWLTSIIDERVNNLLGYFNERFSENYENLLKSLGEKVVPILFKQEFSSIINGKPKLSDKGYALAADMGLLIAKMLLNRFSPKVKWEIVKKPKNDASFHLPVLTGFGNIFLEPVGGSIAEAYGILRNQRESDIWQKIFVTWKDKVQ